MSGISPFMWMLFVWGAVTTVFVILMIYRSLFSLREDDQLFLNPAESLLEAEQARMPALPETETSTHFLSRSYEGSRPGRGIGHTPLRRDGSKAQANG